MLVARYISGQSGKSSILEESKQAGLKPLWGAFVPLRRTNDGRQPMLTSLYQALPSWAEVTGTIIERAKRYFNPVGLQMEKPRAANCAKAPTFEFPRFAHELNAA